MIRTEDKQAAEEAGYAHVVGRAAAPLERRIADLEWALHELAKQASEMIERLDVVFDAEREAIATAYRLVPDVADEAST